MKNILYYFYKNEDSKGYYYSIDMIRLNFDMGKNIDNFYNLIQYLNDYCLDVDVSVFHSYKTYSYKTLFNIVCRNNEETCSFCIGVHLGGKYENKSSGFIEYNPNKCFAIPSFVNIINDIYELCYDVDVVRFDLAIDIKRPRNCVKLTKDGKRVYQLIISDKGVTEYSGKRSHHGFTKVYDKTIESNLDYSLTRVEITIDRSFDIDSVVPNVYINESQFSLDIDNNLSQNDIVELAMLRNIETPEFYLNSMTYRHRKKLLEYMSSDKLEIDRKVFNEIVKEVLKFEKNGFV